MYIISFSLILREFFISVIDLT